MGHRVPYGRGSRRPATCFDERSGDRRCHAGLRRIAETPYRRPKAGKGKRGGARVIYLHVHDTNVIHLVTVYRKDQKDDLSGEEKRLYRQLVQVLKRQARASEGA